MAWPYIGTWWRLNIFGSSRLKSSVRFFLFIITFRTWNSVENIKSLYHINPTNFCSHDLQRNMCHRAHIKVAGNFAVNLDRLVDISPYIIWLRPRYPQNIFTWEPLEIVRLSYDYITTVLRRPIAVKKRINNVHVEKSVCDVAATLRS
jgi:hypothetical protein